MEVADAVETQPPVGARQLLRSTKSEGEPDCRELQCVPAVQFCPRQKGGGRAAARPERVPP